jgi:hypothetical protein
MTVTEFLERTTSVMAARRGDYGQPTVRCSQVLGVPFRPAQEIDCLNDLRVARLAHDPVHLDCITEIAGYAGCLTKVGPGRCRSCLARAQAHSVLSDEACSPCVARLGESRV